MIKAFNIAIKDLRILVSDKGSVFWVMVFPLIYALFFGAIFSQGGGGSASKMNIAVIDNDQSQLSETFINKLDGIEGLQVDTATITLDSATSRVRLGKLTAFVVIKKGFGEMTSMFASQPTLQIGIDPSRRAEEGFLKGMLTQASFSAQFSRYNSPGGVAGELTKLQKTVPYWNDFNDSSKGKANSILGDMIELLEMVPAGDTSTGLSDNSTKADSGTGQNMDKILSGRIESIPIAREYDGPRSSFDITFPSSILWGLIACAASFGVSIVQERVRGTFLRLRLAPINRAHILAGKGLACFMTSLAICVVLLCVGIFILGIQVSSYPILVIGILATSFAFVGIMMLISVLGKTEEAVGGAGWAILMVFAMTGGGMIPVFFMPGWLRAISDFSPVKWGILSLEAGIWRDFSYTEMMLPAGILVGIGLAGYMIGVYILSKADH